MLASMDSSYSVDVKSAIQACAYVQESSRALKSPGLDFLLTDHTPHNAQSKKSINVSYISALAVYMDLSSKLYHSTILTLEPRKRIERLVTKEHSHKI